MNKNNVYISTITRIELLSFPDLSHEETKKINLLLNEFEIVPLIRNIEDLCIAIRKKSKLKIPDAIILATSKYINATLVTSDELLIQKNKYVKTLNPFKSKIKN